MTVVAPDRPGLLWRAAGVLAAHRMVVRSASAASAGSTAVIEFAVVPEYGSPPDPATLEADLRLVLAGRLDIEQRLARRTRSLRPPRVPVAPPRVTLVDDASNTATVVEVRAHDRPGLLWKIGRAFGDCGLDVRAARWRRSGPRRSTSSTSSTGPDGPSPMRHNVGKSGNTCWPRCDDPHGVRTGTCENARPVRPLVITFVGFSPLTSW